MAVSADKKAHAEIAAMRDAAASGVGVANVGGGIRVSMNDIVDLVSSIGGPVDVVRPSPRAGYLRHMGADTRVVASAFGYRPRITIGEGPWAVVDWERSWEPVPA